MSVEDRVLSYLKVNPGATPREIADALGISLASVRIAINRLRELGYVIRSSKGGYVVRVSQELPTPTEIVSNTRSTVQDSQQGIGFDSIIKLLNELSSKVNELEGRVGKLEKEVNYIKKSLPKIPSKHVEGECSDKLLSTLKLRNILSINEVREIISKPLEEYVREGKVVVINDLVVSSEFLKSFKSKFPIKTSEISRLSPEELRLLEALVRSNQAYLYSGVEYRLLD
jgi:biotin operon repressor